MQNSPKTAAGAWAAVLTVALALGAAGALSLGATSGEGAPAPRTSGRGAARGPSDRAPGDPTQALAPTLEADVATDEEPVEVAAPGAALPLAAAPPPATRASAGAGALGRATGGDVGHGAARAGFGDPLAGLDGLSAPRAAPPPPATALPTSGVLASTFVAGHGAASRLDDLMDRGVVVDGERVRLGAFEELGRLPYPVPAAHAVALYAELERTRLRQDGEHVHMQIALVARQGERPRRPRMDVRLVLDRSGSMAGEKWTNAIAAAHALVDRLAPSDTFGLISYAEAASLDRAPARVGDRRAAHGAIDALRPGGATNIGDALDVVAANAPVRRGPNDVLLVVLLSDGQATVGTTDPGSLAARARSMFDGAGIITTTLGVGTDFDEATMLGIAREGSGSYEFVRRSADIAPILTEELDERALAVAQDLRLRIEVAPGVQVARVYGSRVLDQAEAARERATEVAVDARVARELGIARDRQEDDERGLRMHIPSFRRGDQHLVLLELIVPPGAGETEIARVSLDFKDLGTASNEHAVVTVSSERTADAEVADLSVRRPVKRTVLAFQAAETLREASEALGGGDTARADQVLAERIDLLEAAATLWHDESMRRDARLLTTYRRVVDGAWRDWDDTSRHTLVLAMGYYGDQRMD